MNNFIYIRRLSPVTHLLFCVFSLSVFLMLTGCKEIPDGGVMPPPVPALSAGIMVLNEGGFNQNNSSLTYFKFSDSTATTDFFQTQTGRALGDVGNDIQRVGNKLYVLVNVSSKIEVLDARTGNAIRTIPIRDSLNRARQPRTMAFSGNKLFVSNFDGTVSVIDTASLQIVGSVRVGRNPDGMTIQNGRLYVTNSGGLDLTGNFDTTVSVINPATLIEERRIPVPLNPTAAAADGFGDVYILSQGNYSTIPPRVVVINTATNQIKATLPFGATDIKIVGNLAYLISGNRVMTMNVQADTVVNSDFIPSSNFTALYGLDVDTQTGNIYCTDALNFTTTGNVICFGSDGRRRFQFRAGLNPKRMVFLR
jgi:YVTN family beta-propeller protein